MLRNFILFIFCFLFQSALFAKEEFYTYQLGVFKNVEQVHPELRTVYNLIGFNGTVSDASPTNRAWVDQDVIQVETSEKFYSVDVLRFCYGKFANLDSLKQVLELNEVFAKSLNDGILMYVTKTDEGSYKFEPIHEQSSDEFIVPLVDFMASILFIDVFKELGLHDPVVIDEDGLPVVLKDGSIRQNSIPFIVVWLVIGAVFFTIYFGFVNIRKFGHAIGLVSGKFDSEESSGDVSHFQALATALSATVGLGNIAGVALAISIGGAGATFWMIVAGLLGMSTKFAECTLGVKYRSQNYKGEISGGPMYYLSKGLQNKGYSKLGKFLAGLFAVLCIGGSFGGGNMFQANQAYAQIASEFTFLNGYGALFGVVLAVLVGIVIIGGIKSIAKVTEKIVPVMAVLYVLVAGIIIAMNFTRIGEVLYLIYDGAFNATALKGGVVGVLILGFKRAAFSNEAGVGSASIAHSAVKTSKPVTEGIVALLEPFIDTVVICSMTALVLIFTGFHENPFGLSGAPLTSAAFSSVFSWFKYLLMIAIVLFAFSTMISWSYYGLKAWSYLFGSSATSEMIYKLIFLVFIVIGSHTTLGAVVDFSDMMILAMAFPNILGLYILSREVKTDLKVYSDSIEKKS